MHLLAVCMFPLSHLWVLGKARLGGGVEWTRGGGGTDRLIPTLAARLRERKVCCRASSVQHLSSSRKTHGRARHQLESHLLTSTVGRDASLSQALPLNCGQHFFFH